MPPNQKPFNATAILNKKFKHFRPLSKKAKAKLIEFLSKLT